MKKIITPEQRTRIVELLQQQHDRHTIAEIVGVTAGQVSAIAAHVSMGRYRAASMDETAKIVEMPLPSAGIMSGVASLEKGILIGFESDSKLPIFWNPNPEMGSANPHVLILGESGFGKTYTTICLVRELATVGIGSLVVDYGQGFSTVPHSKEAKLLAGATRIELGREGIALNPLEILNTDLHGPASVAQRVADSFARVYSKLGIQQQSLLRTVILNLFANYGITVEDQESWRKSAPELADLQTELTLLSQNPARSEHRIAGSLLSHISSLFLFKVFRKQGRPVAWPSLLSSGTTILSFRGLESKIQLLATEFLLWNCCAYLESRGPERLHSFIVLDEAHRLKISEGSPVEQLTREARKFGLGIILASQQAEDFSPVAFANTGTKIVFQITDERSSVARYIYRKTKSRSFSEIVRTITSLPRGWAYVVTGNVGKVLRVASLDERPTLSSPVTHSWSSNMEEGS